MWLTIGISAIGLLLLADLIVHAVYSIAALHRFETMPALRVAPPPENTPSMEPIQFPTTNGLQLAGGVYFPEDGQPQGVVLFCPENGGTFDTAMNYAQPLVDAGFAVVAFSFRNQSPSDSLPGYRSNYWVTKYEVEDVHAALDFIQSQPQFDGLPIALMGVSRGAGAALAAGAVRPEVSQIWTQGSFSTQGLAMLHAMKFLQTMVGKWGQLIPRWHVRITIWFMLRLNEIRNRCQLVNLESLLPLWRDREVMFVSGARDTYVPAVLTKELCRLSGHSPETSHWVVPHAKHNLERPAAPREFDERIVHFFERVAAPAQETVSRRTIVAK
ncbi:alpha/beta hydrolase [Planctomicrobium sp. SH661]|uniref:alpha/beta hydrolase n=1 Tax=Planctomicrobium sp. SH661 TaxID=3448124 RepID=UPI003F5C4A4A